MDPKELEDLKHRLDDSYIPGSGFLNPWDDYRRERTVPLKEDSEYTLDDLKNMLDYWKDKFNKLISFLHVKLHSWYDKDDKYIDVVNDMYEDNVLDDENIEELDLSKEKDDFER